jgi:hypothetical protein
VDLIDELKSFKSHRSKIKLLQKYYVIDDIGIIEKIDEKIQQFDSKLSNIEKIKREFSTLNLDSILDSNKVFFDLRKSKNESLQKVSLIIKGIETDMKVLSDNFSVVEDILNKIKLLGKDFLYHNKHSQNCPLCEQQIPHKLLATKLDENFKKDIDKTILNEKSKNLSELKVKESRLKLDLKVLNVLESIAQDEVVKYETLTIKEITRHLNFIINEEELILRGKSKIVSTQIQITKIGGSVSEFISLKDYVEKHLKLKASLDKNELENFVFILDNEIKVREEELETIEDANDNLISKLNKSLQLKEYTNDISKVLERFQSQKESFVVIGKSFNKIKKYINLADNKSVSDISKELYVLEENIKSLKDSENRQKELQKITQEIKIAKSFIKENQQKYNRLDKAMAVIEKLKSNDGESTLEDFFSNNLKEIIDIFKTLHLPQEFTDLKFENKKLVLYKNETPHTLSQISTGQRAALVISIFISLNRKNKYGPNIIIFDDPVTFIDDFNALSFLDFLRYFIVKENKQIFFATANKKFSTLFKKKFEFLKDEYKEFELKR